MALDSTDQYIAAARVLLQDEQTVKRYTDPQLTDAFLMGVMEMRRLRPDIFLAFTDDDLGSVSTIDVQYRPFLVEYMVAHSLLREEEETAFQRGMAIKARLEVRLTTPASRMASQ